MDSKITAHTTSLQGFNPWQKAMWKLLFETYGDALINADLTGSPNQPRIRLTLRGGGVVDGWLICATEDGGLQLGNLNEGKHKTTTDVDFSQVAAMEM